LSAVFVGFAVVVFAGFAFSVLAGLAVLRLCVFDPVRREPERVDPARRALVERRAGADDASSPSGRGSSAGGGVVVIGVASGRPYWRTFGWP
jgi:hypothetical protein